MHIICYNIDEDWSFKASQVCPIFFKMFVHSNTYNNVVHLISSSTLAASIGIPCNKILTGTFPDRIIWVIFKRLIQAQCQIMSPSMCTDISKTTVATTINKKAPCKRINQESTEHHIGRRNWSWICHTVRTPRHYNTRAHMEPVGKRGMPRNTWRREMKADNMAKAGFRFNQLEAQAQNRFLLKGARDRKR